ncbi:MAG: PQQ-binding-like beta-propeller repeat protein [Flavobacteriales bacterium]
MKHLSTTILFLSIAFIFTQCKKDNPSNEDSNSPTNPTSDVTINLSGSVIDETFSPIVGATVSINGQNTATDQNGVFQFNNLGASLGDNFVKIEKPGYFFSGKLFLVDAAGNYTVRIKMLEKVLIGTINASSGGSVQSSDGLQLNLPANAIEGGYSGSINVYSRYIDPTANPMSQAIPGLLANNSAGEEGILFSYGMGHIALEDLSGNHLQLNGSSMAQITMPIPSSLQGQANASIPLWYFDESTGIWQEQGSASLQGTSYVGEVSHFSLWNCDDWSCSEKYKINIHCSAVPYSNLPVMFKVGQDPYVVTADGVTNSEGFVITHLPCNSEVRVYTTVTGAAEDLQLLGIISVSYTPADDIIFHDLTSPCPPYTGVSGNAVNADGQPVANGYMQLVTSDLITLPVFFDSNGAFSNYFFDFTPPNPIDVQIKAWDMDNFIYNDQTIIPFNNTMNVLENPIIIGGASAAIGGRIYVASSSSGMFYCLDSADGSEIWSTNFSTSDDEVSPVFYNGKIGSTNLSGTFRCFNSFDGTQLYTTSNPDANSPISADNVFFFSGLGGTLRARNADDATSLWSYSESSGLFSGMSINGNILYSPKGNTTPGVIALNKDDGSLVWEYDAADDVNSNPAYYNGKVYFSSNDQELYALNALTGEYLWQANLDDATELDGSVTVGDGKVIAQSVNHVRAFDAETGQQLWVYNITSTVYGSDPYYYNNKVYAWGGSGIVCLDATNGNLLWEDAYAGFGHTPHYFVVADNVLYMNRYTIPSTMEARNPNTGALIWTSPIEEDMIAPFVVLDANEIPHYCTRSGMQQ